MRRDSFTETLYAVADRKNTTVGELLGTRKRRFFIYLPPKMAAFCGADRLEVSAEDDGISAAELTGWVAYYDNEREDREKAEGRRS